MSYQRWGVEANNALDEGGERTAGRPSRFGQGSTEDPARPPASEQP